MRQRNNAFKEVRYKVAQEALAGIKVGVLARKYDVWTGYTKLDRKNEGG